MIKSLDDARLENKKVLVRCDLNVPIGPDGNITDTNRIDSSLPTIEKILAKGGIPILISHLGRPKGERSSQYSLKPVAKYLSEEKNYSVNFADDCIGESAHATINNAGAAHIVLLENLRFHKEETKNDPAFAEELSKLADVYVNDAFGTAHRAHASTEGVTHFFKEKYAGYLMLKEIKYLAEALKSPQKPFVAILGGAKISGKIDVIKNLMNVCDTILIGGGMMFTFYKALGLNIGKSLLEEDKIELAKELIEEAKNNNTELILPSDVIIAKEFINDTEFKQVQIENIPDDYLGMDIGSDSIANYTEILKEAKTVIWNGPMGVFEMSNFMAGTKAIADVLVDITKNGAVTIVGGGDSAAVISQLGYEDKVSHLSTGGGASLELLEGKTLPGVAALEQ